MYFLINPAHKRKPARKRARRRVALARKANGQFVKRTKAVRRRVRRAQGRTQNTGGSTVATRRRRRRRATVARRAPVRRRRRRAVVRHSAAPVRRRRRRATVSHRRRYRRNPGGGSGVVSTIKQGVKDGALILVGQAVQGRVSSFGAKLVPVGGLPGVVVTDVGSAVVVTMLARRFSPANARMIAGGAFANAVRRVVAAVSPGVAGLLGDGEYVGDQAYLPDQAYESLSAYPDGSMGAYPGGGLGDGAADEHVAYS